MRDRPHQDATSADLEAKLQEVFKEHRDVFEELVVRGWHVELELTTHGFSGAFGYSPSGLNDDAGFSVKRSVSPQWLENTFKRGEWK